MSLGPGIVHYDGRLGARSDPVFDISGIDTQGIREAIGEVDGRTQRQRLAAPRPNDDVSVGAGRDPRSPTSAKATPEGVVSRFDFIFGTSAGLGSA
jgi:hypothetical protein